MCPWTHWMLLPSIVLISIIFSIYRYMTRNFDYWKERGVVYVPPTPFFGNIGDFLLRRTSGGRFVKDLYDYAPNEPYVGFFGFDKPMLMIRDPELVQHILIKDFCHFKDRYAMTGDHDVMGSKSLFVLKNPAWMYLRKKMSPMFTPGKLRNMVVLMEGVGQDLVANIESLDLKEFKGDNIVAQAAVFFLGGFETTSTTISFSLYELAVHPEMQSRLRQEIVNALEQKNGVITYEMISQLPYLDMVVSEILRKYPPLPLLDRVADSDYRVPGTDLIIEKGTPVYVPLTGLHYDSKLHENPEEFNPERFSDENGESTKRAWFPFGDGPHGCIGRKLGLLEVKLGIIEFLRKYEFSPCDKTTLPIELNKSGLNTSAQGGLHLNIKRNSNF